MLLLLYVAALDVHVMTGNWWISSPSIGDDYPIAVEYLPRASKPYMKIILRPPLKELRTEPDELDVRNRDRS